MPRIRLIPRLDIKGPNLIKGIHLEGLRVIGSPNHFARRYYIAGADELVYMDLVASLYGRKNLIDIVYQTTKDVFIPITAGGGVRSTEDVQALLDAGADKVAVNTAVVNNPNLISYIAGRFGSQCMVLSIEAIKQGSTTWNVLTHNGRENTGLDVVNWARLGVELGAGEILLTSVNREGTRKGFDIDLIQAVVTAVGVPIIASGGMGSLIHLIQAVDAGASAVAMADILHYDRMTLQDLRREGLAAGLQLRDQR
jgi:cyclase